MKSQTTIVPLNAERDFQIQELFFSTTDKKGVITSGNTVFARVSGYTQAEMTGRPHNMIRHPDMPRAVFKLFWDYMKAGKPIAAYVKNMASDGRYYWVLALAAPTADGYLSVRFKPSSPLFAVVEAIYRELRALELTYEQGGPEPKAGIPAAEVRLADLLREKGFATYDAFMRAMLEQELGARDARLSHDQKSLFLPQPDRRSGEGPVHQALREIYQECQQVYGKIHELHAQLGACARVNEQLTAQSRTILGLTNEFGLVALNVAIKSSRLGGAGEALGVIATHLAQAAAGVAAIVQTLARQADTVSNWLGETSFSLAWARLQFEMTTTYYREMLLETPVADEAPGGHEAVHLRNLGDLGYAFQQTMNAAEHSLRGLATDLGGLSANVEDLRKAMLSLRVAHISGLVEARRLTEDESFSAIFDEVRKTINGTEEQLSGFGDIIRQLAGLSRQTPVIMRTVVSVSKRMGDDEQRLVGLAEQRAVPAGTPAPGRHPAPSASHAPQARTGHAPPAGTPRRAPLAFVPKTGTTLRLARGAAAPAS